MPVHSPQSIEEVVTGTLQRIQDLAKGKRTVWGTPVPHDAEPVFAQGFVVTPAAYGAANRVIICSYEVPRGYAALICGLVTGYIGGGSAPIPGQIITTVDVNNPSAPVVSPQEGYTEKDYAAIPFQLGSFVDGPVWPVEFLHEQNEFVRLKAYAVSGVSIGPGNFFYGALLGWQWPSQGWE